MAAGSPRKVRPLSKRHQPKEPVPPFKEGEVVTTRYKPLFYTIEHPTKVLSCQQNKLCVSGWAITVQTSDGDKVLDSQLFAHDTK